MPNKKQRELQRVQIRKQQKTKRLAYIVAGALAVAIALAGVAIYVNPTHASTTVVSTTADCSDIQSLPDQGNAHLLPGQTHEYAENPPASGPHDPNPWPAGVYDVTIPATREVHSLEHGYILIHYNGIPSDQVQQLADLVRADSFKMILSPLTSMPYPVSLTAWDHLQQCKSVNVPVIRSFITRFRDHGPEQTPM